MLSRCDGVREMEGKEDFLRRESIFQILLKSSMTTDECHKVLLAMPVMMGRSWYKWMAWTSRGNVSEWRWKNDWLKGALTNEELDDSLSYASEAERVERTVCGEAVAIKSVNKSKGVKWEMLRGIKILQKIISTYFCVQCVSKIYKCIPWHILRYTDFQISHSLSDCVTDHFRKRKSESSVLLKCFLSKDG